MNNDNNLGVLTTIVSALKGLDPEAQKRTLYAVITFLDIPLPSLNFQKNGNYNSPAEPRTTNSSLKDDLSFSEDRSISPKDFLRDKSPRTDLERIACLAYYLTHYRSLPHFKTFDLSSLNTEAAQPKLSNPTVAVDNAAKAGILVQALKGKKQLSSAGEMFVQALPDREAAKASLANFKARRRKKSPAKNINTNASTNSNNNS